MKPLKPETTLLMRQRFFAGKHSWFEGACADIYGAVHALYGIDDELCGWFLGLLAWAGSVSPSGSLHDFYDYSMPEMRRIAEMVTAYTIGTYGRKHNDHASIMDAITAFNLEHGTIVTSGLSKTQCGANDGFYLEAHQPPMGAMTKAIYAAAPVIDLTDDLEDKLSDAVDLSLDDLAEAAWELQAGPSFFEKQAEKAAGAFVKGAINAYHEHNASQVIAGAVADVVAQTTQPALDKMYDGTLGFLMDKIDRFKRWLWTLLADIGRFFTPSKDRVAELVAFVKDLFSTVYSVGSTAIEQLGALLNELGETVGSGCLAIFALVSMGGFCLIDSWAPNLTQWVFDKLLSLFMTEAGPMEHQSRVFERVTARPGMIYVALGLLGVANIGQAISLFNNLPRFMETVSNIPQGMGHLFRAVAQFLGFDVELKVAEMDISDINRMTALYIKQIRVVRDPETMKEIEQFHSDLCKSGRKDVAVCVARLGRAVVMARENPGMVAKTRPEPTFFFLSGSPGVGKSSAVAYVFKPLLLKAILRDPVLAAYLPKKSEVPTSMLPDVWCYPWQFGDFEEGYAGNFAVEIDDAFQSKDPSTASRAAAQVVGMGSCGPYSIDAAFESKGWLSFISLLIMGTTNNERIENPQAHSPEAFARRFTHLFHTTVRPVFYDRDLNTQFIILAEERRREGGTIADLVEVAEQVAASAKARRADKPFDRDLLADTQRILSLSQEELFELVCTYEKQTPSGTMIRNGTKGSFTAREVVEDVIQAIKARVARHKVSYDLEEDFRHEAWWPFGAQEEPDEDEIVDKRPFWRQFFGIYRDSDFLAEPERDNEFFDVELDDPVAEIIPCPVELPFMSTAKPWWYLLVLAGAFGGAYGLYRLLFRQMGFEFQTNNVRPIKEKVSKLYAKVMTNGPALQTMTLGYAVCVNRRAVVVPKHMMDVATSVWFEFDAFPGNIYRPMGKQVVLGKDLDAVMVEVDLPREVPMACLSAWAPRDIINEMFSDVKIKGHAKIIFYDQDNVESLAQTKLGENTKLGTRTFDGGYNSRQGDCGLPVFFGSGVSQASPIVGIHTKGRVKGYYSGNFTMISREVIVSGLNELGLPVCTQPNLALSKTGPHHGKKTIPVSEVFGSEVAQLMMGSKTNTKVCSEINAAAVGDLVDCYQTRDEMWKDGAQKKDALVPADLRPKVKVCFHAKDAAVCDDTCFKSPALVHQAKSIAKPGVSLGWVDTLRDVRDWFVTELADGFPECRVLDPTEVYGPKRLSFFTPLKLKSSPGVTLKKGATTDAIVHDPSFVPTVREFIRSFEGEQTTVFPIKMFPKDEAIKVKKVLEGGTRQIAAANPLVKVAQRCVLGEPIAYINAHQLDRFGFANCINPITEGDRLRDFLNADEPGWKFMDIDIKNQDVSLSSFMTDAWSDFIVSLFPEEIKPLVANFMEAGHCSANVMATDRDKSEFAWRYDDISSGKYDTSAENTFCAILQAYCAMTICTSHHWRLAREYMHDFRVIACGDDVVLGLGPSIHELVKPEDWIAAYALLGLTATSGRKDGLMAYNDSLDDCVFLKRNFGIVKGPRGEQEASGALALQSIFKRFVFVRPDLTDEQKKNMKEGALMELARHGSETYNKESRRIKECFKEVSVLWTFVTAWNRGKELAEQVSSDKTVPWPGFQRIMECDY
jgi:hypothetical protein